MCSHGPYPALLIKGMGVLRAQGPVELAFLEVKEPALNRRDTSYFSEALPSAVVDVSSTFNADLNPRIPSPMPLASSGIFLGPSTSKAIPRMINRCVG